MGYADWKKRRRRARIDDANERARAADWYWIAVNGASVAAWLKAPVPKPSRVTPAPEFLVGFPEHGEACDVHRRLRAASEFEVRCELTDLGRRPDLSWMVGQAPEPPADDVAWTFPGIPPGNGLDWIETPRGRMPRYPAILRFRSSTTTEEIAGRLAAMKSVVRAVILDEHVPFLCLVPGYERDPRELWEISEVHALARRLVDTGVFGLVHPGLPPERNGRFFGAVDIWALAHELYVQDGPRRGRYRLSHEQLDEFADAYEAGRVRLLTEVLGGVDGLEEASGG